MATVTVKIDKKDYQLACSDGEEDHLIDLCEDLNARTHSIGKVIGTANHSLLLVATAISLLDELRNLKANGASDEAKKLSAEQATAEVFGEVIEKIKTAKQELEAGNA